jgi:L-lactate dehydrogenase complex protein LldF
MNHCPVYGSIGGHAYGWVYPGPMGSVLTPLMIGLENAQDLPNASTLCGRCEAVCPMKIPLPSLLRQHRIQAYQRKLMPKRARWALRLWRYLAQRPRLYHALAAIKIRALHLLGAKKGGFRYLPFASAWTKYRDFPAPQTQTFMSQWQKQQVTGNAP